MALCGFSYRQLSLCLCEATHTLGGVRTEKAWHKCVSEGGIDRRMYCIPECIVITVREHVSNEIAVHAYYWTGYSNSWPVRLKYV